MIVYRGSDIKLSWDHTETGAEHVGPRTCGYVKEGIELETDEDDFNDEEDENNLWKTRVHRAKRQVDQYEYTPTKTRCPLLLVADYRFFQEMGASNTKTTINYLVFFKAINFFSVVCTISIFQISLIDRVHKIYNDTIWHDRQEIDGFKGMGFVIKKIVVHSEPTRVRGGEAHYNMVREKWDVRNLLEVCIITSFFVRF